jgi:cytoskeleton protein RodZ
MMPSAIEKDRSPPLAPRAGADLRAARDRVGWTLQELAPVLHIRLDYLEALEAGRISALPSNAHALGFLRTYAAALGLDPNDTARRFKAEAVGVNEKTELDFPEPAPERGVPAGAVALLGVLLAVGAYAGWYRLSGEGRLPAETTMQIPSHLAPLAEQAVRPSTAPVVAATPAPAEAPTVQQAEAPAAPAISPTSAAAAVPVPPVPDGQSRILIRVSADAWLQVRDREVPPKPNLVLTTGNAGGTDLVVDGVTSPPLGGSGAVRRDLPLDPDLIKDGKLATPPRPSGQ